MKNREHIIRLVEHYLEGETLYKYEMVDNKIIYTSWEGEFLSEIEILEGKEIVIKEWYNLGIGSIPYVEHLLHSLCYICNCSTVRTIRVDVTLSPHYVFYRTNKFQVLKGKYKFDIERVKQLPKDTYIVSKVEKVVQEFSNDITLMYGIYNTKTLTSTFVAMTEDGEIGVMNDKIEKKILQAICGTKVKPKVEFIDKHEYSYPYYPHIHDHDSLTYEEYNTHVEQFKGDCNILKIIESTINHMNIEYKAKLENDRLTISLSDHDIYLELWDTTIVILGTIAEGYENYGQVEAIFRLLNYCTVGYKYTRFKYGSTIVEPDWRGFACRIVPREVKNNLLKELGLFKYGKGHHYRVFDDGIDIVIYVYKKKDYCVHTIYYDKEERRVRTITQYIRYLIANSDKCNLLGYSAQYRSYMQRESSPFNDLEFCETIEELDKMRKTQKLSLT